MNIVILPLLLVQCVLFFCAKNWVTRHRFVLLIIPVLYFFLFVFRILFRTYPGVPSADNAKINVVHMLIDSLQVLLLLLPFAFTFIKKWVWRILILVVLLLNIPALHFPFDSEERSFAIASRLYTVHFQTLDSDEPYISFEWNWQWRDQYEW